MFAKYVTANLERCMLGLIELGVKSFRVIGEGVRKRVPTVCFRVGIHFQTG